MSNILDGFTEKIGLEFIKLIRKEEKRWKR